LPSRRWLVVAAAVVIIASTVALIVTKGRARHAPHRPSPSIAAAVPKPSPTAAPGTVLLTCDSATAGSLGSHWRAGSFRAGPLWFVSGRRDGYVHDSRYRMQARSRYRGVKFGVMIIEVANGATVTMEPAPGARDYFRFVDGFDGPSPNYLPAPDIGFTLSACPRRTSGPSGRVTDFYLGFVFTAAANPALVDIRPRNSARPIRVIFTYPHR